MSTGRLFHACGADTLNAQQTATDEAEEEFRCGIDVIAVVVFAFSAVNIARYVTWSLEAAWFSVFC